LAIVTNVGRDAVDAAASQDERRCYRLRWSFGGLRARRSLRRRVRGRRSHVVLAPRRWRQVSWRRCRPARADTPRSTKRRWQKSPVTEESVKETVKTIAQGRPGVTGEPVVTTLVCFIYFAHEAAGASDARLSLRPPFSW